MHHDLDLSNPSLEKALEKIGKSAFLIPAPAPVLKKDAAGNEILDMDFSYQNKKDISYMMHPKSGYIHVDSEPENDKKEKKNVEKMIHLYTIDPSPFDESKTEFQSFVSAASKNEVLDFGDEPLKVQRLVLTDFKSKPCLIIDECSEKDGQPENHQVNNMFKKAKLQMYGRSHLILFKQIHSNTTPDEEGKVSIVNKTSSRPKKESKEDKNIKINSQISRLLISKEDLQKQEEIEKLAKKYERDQKNLESISSTSSSSSSSTSGSNGLKRKRSDKQK